MAARESHVRGRQILGEKSPQFICPVTGCALELQEDTTLISHQGKVEYRRDSGIWRFLASERERHFAGFVQDYQAVRAKEGRGANDSDYYRALPFADLSGKFAGNWRIRAASYHVLVGRLLTPFTRAQKRPANILDLGAGNCWLSNRLAGLGHQVVALDLLDNSTDGLGAHRHYETSFECVQAEFDHLPFADNQFDFVIFNASLHYSEAYLTTMSEALRVLAPGGSAVILDSPVYRDGTSGRKMVKERENDFERRFGFRSNALSSENFLTFERLDLLGRQLQLNWEFIRPFYGLRWRLKPFVAKIRRRREPAQFFLIVGTREKEG